MCQLEEDYLELEDEIDELKDEIEDLDQQISELKAEIDERTITEKEIGEMIWHADIDLKKLIEEIGPELVKKTLETI